jgi:hypothetical protein
MSRKIYIVRRLVTIADWSAHGFPRAVFHANYKNIHCAKFCNALLKISFVFYVDTTNVL